MLAPQDRADSPHLKRFNHRTGTPYSDRFAIVNPKPSYVECLGRAPFFKGRPRGFFAEPFEAAVQGGATELRLLSSVGRSTRFGADRIPSTLCKRRRAAVAPS